MYITSNEILIESAEIDLLVTEEWLTKRRTLSIKLLPVFVS